MFIWLKPSRTSLLSDQASGTQFPEACASFGLQSPRGLRPNFFTHRFVMLSLEFDYMCQYDYVEVRDGDNSDGQIIKRFCGNERPAPIRSMGSSLHILFHSDGSKNFDGFHAIFEEITGKGHRDICSALHTNTCFLCTAPLPAQPYSDLACWGLRRAPTLSRRRGMVRYISETFTGTRIRDCYLLENREAG